MLANEIVAEVTKQVTESAPGFGLKAVNAAVQRAAAYSPAVRAIWGAKNGHPTHIGSCVLIQVGSERLILTAAHVADEHASTPLHIALSEIEPLPDDWISSVAPQNDRDDDTADWAIMRLPVWLEDKLGDAIFIPEEMLCVRSNPEDAHYTCIGFPNSKNRDPWRGVTHVKGQQHCYTNTGCSVSLLPSRAVPERNLLLKFDGKFSRRADGERANTVRPRGYSGGAIFDVGNLRSVIDLFSPPPVRLAGLYIEAHRHERCIMGTRVDFIIDELRARGWL